MSWKNGIIDGIMATGLFIFDMTGPSPALKDVLICISVNVVSRTKRRDRTRVW